MEDVVAELQNNRTEIASLRTDLSNTNKKFEVFQRDTRDVLVEWKKSNFAVET